MMKAFAFLDRLRPGRSPVPSIAPSVPEAVRLYVVGDIHGRLDCLDDLLARIEADRAGYDGAVEYIFLGDLVDRGPDSAGVVDRLLTLSRGETPVRLLMGNHEEVLLLAMSGDRAALALFERIGGRATMRSYGLDPVAYDAMAIDDRPVALARAVPKDHFAFLSAFQDSLVIGDYRFVHAGVRPGIDFDQQKTADLRWIRAGFLDHDAAFEGMIVHGHTVTDAVDRRTNRIGIDTGAYKSGRLTCLVLEGRTQRFLQTQRPA
ncbi:metallophosphoesterase family protein [soil metagenome]